MTIMGSRFTKYDLDHVTDYIEFEAFCSSLMSREGYKDIEPLGGFKDKGRDAVHVSKSTGETTIFAYSVREDWEDKLDEDLEKVHKHKHSCNNVVFITTSTPTPTQKDNNKKAVESKYGWRLEFYDLERIATLVDNQHKELKQLHPSIFIISSRITEQEQSKDELNRELYAEYLLGAYQEWLERYTPLLADHREVEPYVLLTESEQAPKEIPVAEIPDIAPVAVVLGESGSGKTTALWKIIVEISKSLKADKTDRIPILISLRGWAKDHRCRNLVQEQFELIGVSRDAVEQELQDGKCLILIDGLNELRPDEHLRTEAYQELQRFLSKYQNNVFVICCRAIDYEPRMLDPEVQRLKFPEPKVFEIRRMGRDQIIDYVQRYFKDAPSDSDNLLSRLDIHNERLWEDTSSILHLARIPLYLQLMITEFKRSKELPSNRAKLLKTLVHTIMQQERLKHAASVDHFAKERLLGSSAYKAIRKGYSLRLPDYEAQEILRAQLQKLKEESLIQPDLTFGAVWQEILSNNFLKVVDWLSIEWLHQLIFDYFLGSEIVRIWTGGIQAEIDEMNLTIDSSTLGQPCAIALGLLAPSDGARFLEHLITINIESAQEAFEGQSDEEQRQVSRDIIFDIIVKEEETERLNQVAVSLPYLPIIETLSETFRNSLASTRANIAEAISLMMMSYYVKIAAGRGSQEYRKEMESRELRYKHLRRSIKRASELLSAWTNNKDELVRFYSIKGLWEYDRGLAAKTLKKLYLENSPKTQLLVKRLMDDWGINPYE